MLYKTLNKCNNFSKITIKKYNPLLKANLPSLINVLYEENNVILNSKKRLCIVKLSIQQNDLLI